MLLRISQLSFVIVVAFGLALASCASAVPGESVTGSGTLATETRDVSGVTSVNMTGSGELTVELGDREAIVIEAEDNLLPYITTDVSGQQLVIGTRPNMRLHITTPIRYRLTVKQLEGVTLAGSGTVSLPELQGKQMDFTVSGSGAILAAGAVDQLTVNLPGSGSIDGVDLRATTARVNIPGSGTTFLWATDELDVTIAGSGNVRYYGNPAVSERITGSGTVLDLGDK